VFMTDAGGVYEDIKTGVFGCDNGDGAKRSYRGLFRLANIILESCVDS